MNPIDFSEIFKGLPDSVGSNLCKKIANPPQLTTRSAFCLWTDLLGFGNIFSLNNWKLSDKQKREVYNRLLCAHSAVLYYSKPDERNLILNDGIAKVYIPDNSFQGKPDINIVSLFFRSCVELHMTINQTDQANGYPGCRSVMAFGDSIEYIFEEVKFDDYVMNYSKPIDHNLSSIADCLGNPTIIYNPKELQMNTAFSKAYIIENGGSGVGVPGNNFYIDQSVVDAIAECGMEKGYSPIWRELDNELLFLIPYRKNNLNEVVMGFSFDKKEIVPSIKQYSTKVYKLLKFFPHDEPIDSFCFDLGKDLFEL